ncbi:Hypothetical protein HVR_LOCUS272 [uncultured virus]|nr:Hypothetical protein HVR_LOCUS272 [uncultured virus]
MINQGDGWTTVVEANKLKVYSLDKIFCEETTFNDKIIFTSLAAQGAALLVLTKKGELFKLGNVIYSWLRSDKPILSDVIKIEGSDPWTCITKDGLYQVRSNRLIIEIVKLN